jgi:hypothetical protein
LAKTEVETAPIAIAATADNKILVFIYDLR